MLWKPRRIAHDQSPDQRESTPDVFTRPRNGESPPRHNGRNGLSCKRRGRLEAGLTLRVLLSLTGLLETGLLALDDAGVTTQVTGLLQGGAVVLGVDLVQ